MLLITLLAAFTSLSFFAYGTSCLTSQWMRTEFERYGLPRFRTLTGWLEILGALGVMIGLAFPWIGFFAASGLTLLMVGGFSVRLRIKDSLLQTLPSFLYLLLTLYLAFLFLQIQ